MTITEALSLYQNGSKRRYADVEVSEKSLCSNLVFN